MGNRLTKIFTKKGDDGSTDIGGNQRVPKYDQTIQVYGSIDELSAAIGLITTEENIPIHILDFLNGVQQNLFNISGEISAPQFQSIDENKVTAIEIFIDELNEKLPALKDFVVPGVNKSSAFTHQSRAICRRAERELFKLAEEKEVNKQSLKYINRLSDAFFVIARTLAREVGEETIWDHERK
jgi:cob(I)alamin adenosyltransferase|tara:strand:- start:15 stop:563 length:549 start_codon:yes stop_codon:yes gene_type:complete